MDPIVFTSINRRLERIVREVVIKCVQSARSSVIQAGDFSVAVADGKCRLISVAEGIPIHTMTIGMALEPVSRLFDDIAPGDCFLNNSPFHECGHHADYTFLTPVFDGDRIIFWVILRAHQADTGAPEPTTYLPFAKEVYEEGLHWPCVRVCRNYKELPDVVRIGLTNIRVPDQWHGDFAAAVGTSRIGEGRLKELIDAYRAPVLDEFTEEWLDYGRRRMIAEIANLPAGTWEEETVLDPLPFAPEGIRLKMKLTIEPKEGYITVDLTENPDQYEAGVNLTHAMSIAAPMEGLFWCLDPTLPHNTGAFERIKFVLREGSVCGIPHFPVGTSVATSFVADRLASCAIALMSKIDPNRGGPEDGCLGWQIGVFSGEDFRRENASYIDQMVLVGGFSGGGPAVKGHDGWATWYIGGASGRIWTTAVELWGKRHPHIVEVGAQVCTDSGGYGEFMGSVAPRALVRPRKGSFNVAGYWDGKVYPPKGVSGGGSGQSQTGTITNWTTGEPIRELPLIGIFEVKEGEALSTTGNGGGGFGDPLDRDPEKVAKDVMKLWISEEKARATYGVVLIRDSGGVEVDAEATHRLRNEMRSVGSKAKGA